MTEPATRDAGFSVAAMVTDVASDVTRLVRQEVELAMNEIRREVGKAASAGRLIGSGALALHLVAVLVSVAAALSLSEILGDRLPELSRWIPALAAAGLGLLWLAVGLVLLTAAGAGCAASPRFLGRPSNRSRRT